MITSGKETVGDIAVRVPGATRIFEKVGIDYCCGGHTPLHDACEKAGIDLDVMLASLRTLEHGSSQSGARTVMASAPLGEIVDHILATHHAFTRQELERLGKLFEKVCAAHGERHPKLIELRSLYKRLNDDLQPHLLKEERVLFPYIVELARAAEQRGPAPFAPFGTVRNPVRMMGIEHDEAGELLKQIRQLTNNHIPPPGACASFHALYQALERLEQDLHEHIHLENNVLFPRAIDMEDSLFG
jgi:regulator of cell morphogenesis and NO signaling